MCTRQIETPNVKVSSNLFIFLSPLSYTMHRKRHLRLYNDSIPDFITPLHKRHVNSGLPVVNQ